MYIFEAGSTDITIYVRLRDSTTGLAKTGLAYNSAGASAYYTRPRAAATAITLATQTVTGAHSDGGFVEVDATNAKGLYRLDLPDAAVAASAEFVIISIEFDGIIEESALIKLSPSVNIASANADSLTASALATDAVNEIADGVWDEDIVAAHSTSDTAGLIVSQLTKRSGLTFNTEVADGSIIGQLADDGTASYDRTTDSLQALRDRGDAAWTTGGGSITDIINPILHIPPAIDIANTATMRIGMQLTNMLDDLPTTAEITPGTISIDRKAAAATSWSSIVSDAAMSESDGWIYYDEVFDSATGYERGDIIRFTFKGQKVTVAANDYEIFPSAGIYVYTWIPETNGLTTALIADAVWDELLSGHAVSGSFGEAITNLADTVWDEVMESGASANAKTARQWLRIMAAVLFGADADAGDWSALSIDGVTTRVAGTLNASGKRTSIDTLDGS